MGTPASSTSTYGVRSKYGSIAVRPRSPGSSGKIQRIGWLTANTQIPPGRSTRATSRMTRAESATNGTAPNAEHAMSKLSSAKGRSSAPACTSGTRGPPRSIAVSPRASIPMEMSRPTARAPRPASQRAHGADPQPSSRTSLPATSPSRCTSPSCSPSGHHTNSPSAESTPRNSPWVRW
ncbi:hypothetical protein GQ85_29270 [Rhodococcus rhodochrous]|nr:hypothetical protein GQ85_29270 [Rhodococcus rhodochrous]